MNYNEQLADQRGIHTGVRVLLEGVYTKLNALLKRPQNYAHTGAEAVEKVAALEYVLQYLWEFELDSKFHRYSYRINGCLCGTLDNDEMVGYTSDRWVNASCKFHGDSNGEPLNDQTV